MSSNKTFRVVLEKLGGVNSTEYVGREGEIFFDPDNPVLKVGDGTPGGGSLGGGGGGGADTGDITFSGASIIGNSVPGFDRNAITLIPDNRTVDGWSFTDYGQFINIYPTNAYDSPHIHIAAGSGSGSAGDLMLGDDNHYVEINNQGYVGVKTNDPIRGNQSYWYFGQDGTFAGPGMGMVSVPALSGAPGNDLYLTSGGNTRNTTTLQFADADGTEKSIYTVDTNNYYVGNIPFVGGSQLWFNPGSSVTVTNISISGNIATFTLSDPVVLNALTDYTLDWYGTDTHDVVISTANNTWRFQDNGSLNDNGSYTRTTTPFIPNTSTSGVIWTSLFNYISSVKLTIQLECYEVGDESGWHTQVCEAVIASRGAGQYGEPIMTVYGVTYTSTQPLASFSVQRNPVDNTIEVVATRTAATTDGIDFRIHSVEIASRD